MRAQLTFKEFPQINFSQCERLLPRLRHAIKEGFQFDQCTPVQSAILTHLPLKSDLIVQAKTGTGKTLAFAVSALNDALGSPKSRRILIVAPARELAIQSAEEMKKLARPLGLTVATLIGGASKLEQSRNIDRYDPEIIVGTPGRLIDMLESEPKFARILETTATVVLDEADRMLEIGFSNEIKKLFTAIPDTAHRLLFSATFPNNLQELIKEHMRPNFEAISTINPDEAVAADTVKQCFHVCADDFQMYTHARNILKRYESDSFKALVFTQTVGGTELLADLLVQSGLKNVIPLHSRQTQAGRSRSSNDFRSAKAAVMVTTDVSARGVDYPNVDLVMQLGVPSGVEKYVHRIGRTGRGEKTGEAVLLLTFYDEWFVRQMKSALIPISPATVDDEGRVNLSREGGSESLTQSSAALVMKPDYQLRAEIGRNLASSLGYYMSRLDCLRRYGINSSDIGRSQLELARKLGMHGEPRIPDSLQEEFRVFESALTRRRM